MDKDDEKKIKIRAYLDVFGTDNGKLVLADLKTRADFDYIKAQPVGNDNHTDIYQVMHREGKRSIVAYIVGMLKKDPNEQKGIKNE